MWCFFSSCFQIRLFKEKKKLTHWKQAEISPLNHPGMVWGWLQQSSFMRHNVVDVVTFICRRVHLYTLFWWRLFAFRFQLVVLFVCFQALIEELRRLFDKYLVKILQFKKVNCTELIPLAELNGVVSLCRLFDSLATVENGVGITKERFKEDFHWFLSYFEIFIQWSEFRGIVQINHKRTKY